MEHNEHNHKSLWETLKFIIFVCIFFYVIGFITLFVSRLFLAKGCSRVYLPKTKHCILVGLAITWTYICLFYTAENELPISQKNTTGWHYKIEGNKIIFANAPTEKFTSQGLGRIVPYSPLKVHFSDITDSNDKLYLVGKIDGNNKEFSVSKSENITVTPNMTLENNIYITSDNYCLTHPTYRKWYAKFFGYFVSIMIIGYGFVAWVQSVFPVYDEESPEHKTLISKKS